MTALRALRRLLSARSVEAQPHLALSRMVPEYEALVTAYYVVSVFFAMDMMMRAHGLSQNVTTWTPLWTLRWLGNPPDPAMIQNLGILVFFVSLLTLHFRRYLAVRAVFAVVFLLAASLANSVGGINHPYHAWFWVGFVFIFLPSGRVETLSRAGKLSYATVFLTAQALFLGFYSMAGMHKVAHGLQSLLAGEPGNFSPSALSWTLADRILQTGTTPPWAEYVIGKDWLVWPLFLGVMYIQFFGVVAAFRPRLHLLWGWGIIMFHAGTWLFMEILFMQHVLLLVLLLALSPRAPTPMKLGEMLADLPLLGRLFVLLLPKGTGASVRQA